jgi:hypothetical protein
MTTTEKARSLITAYVRRRGIARHSQIGEMMDRLAPDQRPHYGWHIYNLYLNKVLTRPARGIYCIKT